MQRPAHVSEALYQTGPTRRAAAAAALAVAGLPRAAFAGGRSEGSVSFRRGIGIYHMMQAPERTGADRRPVWPAFGGAIHAMPDTQIRALRQAGFDFVRLTLAPDVFVRAKGADANALYDLLRANVARFVGRDLSVIVSLMPGEAARGFANADFADNEHGVFDALCDVVGRCASVLDGVAPGRVALEPLNEPALWGFAEGRWSAMQQRLHQAVRAVSHRMAVVLTGAESGDLKGLLKLDPRPYRGSNVLYSFHYYEPHIFTHQHASESFRYLRGVTWPPQPRDLPAVLARATAAIAADEALSSPARAETIARVRAALSTYELGGQGPQTLMNDFAKVAAWADRHGIDRSRVLLGEFGVTRTLGGYAAAPDADGLAWLGAVRAAAEARGFAWAFWALSGPVAMTLANEYPARGFDPGVLKALGLRNVQP